MERQHKITQIYGYSVCLVAVITSLIAVASLVDAVFNLSAPLADDARHDAETGHGSSLKDGPTGP